MKKLLNFAVDEIDSSMWDEICDESLTIYFCYSVLNFDWTLNYYGCTAALRLGHKGNNLSRDTYTSLFTQLWFTPEVLTSQLGHGTSLEEWPEGIITRFPQLNWHLFMRRSRGSILGPSQRGQDHLLDTATVGSLTNEGTHTASVSEKPLKSISH